MNLFHGIKYDKTQNTRFMFKEFLIMKSGKLICTLLHNLLKNNTTDMEIEFLLIVSILLLKKRFLAKN